MNCTPNVEVLTAQQAARRAFRVSLFTARGTGPERAHELATQLVHRDADLDDRRLCLECAHLRSRASCKRPGHSPLPEMLQRCPSFNWQKPSTT